LGFASAFAKHGKGQPMKDVFQDMTPPISKPQFGPAIANTTKTRKSKSKKGRKMFEGICYYMRSNESIPIEESMESFKGRKVTGTFLQYMGFDPFPSMELGHLTIFEDSTWFTFINIVKPRKSKSIVLAWLGNTPQELLAFLSN